jgi:alkyl hydroperoxide reductase subunit AhpF
MPKDGRHDPHFRLPGRAVTPGHAQNLDVLVIGSGPGGQKAAVAAAKLDRRVAIVERP